MSQVLAFLMVVALFEFASKGTAIPAVFDIAEQLDADFVGIELRGRAGHGAAVMIAVVDNVGASKALIDHDGRMPVTGPPFVHDLGLCLWRKIIGFVTNN